MYFMRSVQNMLKRQVLKTIKKLGYTIFLYKKEDVFNSFPVDFRFLHKDFNIFHKETLKLVKDFTMTSPERLYGLIEAVKYISMNNIKGDIVECGVWRGGSMMAVANTLLSINDTQRNLYLFDTFDGMSEPDSRKDIDTNQMGALTYLSKNKKSEDDFIWAYAPLDSVRQNLFSIGYPRENINFIKGKVEETLPYNKIKEIALLRLDTDWYASTKHEMDVLFPLIKKGGVLIIDDYGHWEGAKKAIDEYIQENNVLILLNRLDYSGRIAIKQ